MCIGGRLGLEINTTSNIFAEVNGCLLVEITPSDVSTFENQFASLPFTKIGTVTNKPILKFDDVEISIEELVNAFNTHS